MTYKKLTVQEEKQFKQWARDNFDPGKGSINVLWHPIIKLECLRMLSEHLNLFISPSCVDGYKLEVFTDRNTFAEDRIKG